MASRPPLALAYHGVATVRFSLDRYRLFAAPGQVSRDVRALRRWGYEFVTFGHLARRVSDDGGEGLAALTFDDGFADNATVLAPLLQALDATATVFVVSGWIGTSHPDSGAPILTSTQLRSLHSQGIEIGTHTASHRSLTDLDSARVCEELIVSRTALEELLHAPVSSLAYPYGEANERVRRICAEVGIRAACRTSGEGSWEDPLDLPRQAMANGSSLLGLRLKRSNRCEPLLEWPGMRQLRRISRRLHSAGWNRRARSARTPQPLPHSVSR